MMSRTKPRMRDTKVMLLTAARALSKFNGVFGSCFDSGKEGAQYH